MLVDLAASPTPYHAVARSLGLLTEAGFVQVELDQPFPSSPGSYVTTVSGTLIAWISPDVDSGRGFVVVGAHTDSPNLRVRLRPDVTSAGWSQVGVEVYGGVLTNSWLDRDLGLAGRVVVRSGGPEATKTQSAVKPAVLRWKSATRAEVS